MECPNCFQELPFLSRAIHSGHPIAPCPQCGLPMRREFAIGRVVLFSFLIGAPIRFLGIYVPALSFLDNLLTMAASIWLGTMLGMRFRRVDPMLDSSAPTAEAGKAGGVTRPLPVPAIVAVWLLYGLLVWDGIARGHLGNLPLMAWETVGQWVPSIRQTMPRSRGRS